MSRVAQPASATPPPVLCGKTAIFRAIRPGTRRCRDQREWLRTVLDAIEAEPWYANRRAHYAAIARQLMRHMHWRERTTRPGHERIAVAVGVSPDTVARAVAWMRDRGLLGLVSPGSTPLLRPYALHGDEGNLAVVYVCTVPRKRARQLSPPEAGHGSFADLTRSRSDRVSVPRAREAKPQVKPRKARAALGQPMLARPGNGDLNAHPQTRSERLTAARAMQDRFRVLRRLSDRHIRHLARPFTLAGWTPADVLFAIDHEPRGRQHGYTTEIRSPAAWMAARLALWLDPAIGTPLPSRSQLAAAQRRQVLAEQAARREVSNRRPAGDYPAQAARARALLAEALAKSRGTVTMPRNDSETA